jgi:hypothetical protein
MLVGKTRQFVKTAAGKPTQPVEMRFERRKIVTCQIKWQQIAQATIDCVEILSSAIRRKQSRAAVGVGREWGAGERGVHGDLLSRPA